MRTLLAAALLFPAVAYGQSSVCHDAGVVFVGRADRTVTFHISGEAAIERALQNVKRAEEAISRERAELGPRMPPERDTQLEKRRIEAMEELEWQRNSNVPPYDLTFIPLRIEAAIRGVTESTVMLLDQHLPMPLEPDQSYLIVGHRRDGLVPPLPHLAHLDYLNSSIQATRVVPAGSAQQELAFLAATKSGATILGTLRRRAWGGGPMPIGGVHILVSSSGNMAETVTKEDGSFAIFGIRAGRIEIRPDLPPNLAVVNTSALTRQVQDGACDQVHLTADVNGRVRGRLISASGRSMNGAAILLSYIDPTRFRLDPSVHTASSHAPRLKAAVAEDGTYEFVGVPAGTYLLIASFPKAADGKQTMLTTFYPGTAQQSDAVPVTVGEATEHNGFDFVVRME
jgi:hypothetical protein